MYSHRNEFTQECGKYVEQSSSEIFSCICASANTSPACICANTGSPRIVPACARISKFSRISRKWPDSPLFSRVWGFLWNLRKWTFLKRPLFQQTPFFAKKLKILSPFCSIVCHIFTENMAYDKNNEGKYREPYIAEGWREIGKNRTGEKLARTGIVSIFLASFAF